MDTMTPRVLSTGTITGDPVVNAQGEDLGNIQEVMIDVSTGQIAYVVLSFGGILGLGDKLFAIPWEAFTLDAENERFVLNVDRETLKEAPGFDKNDWPQTTDRTWIQSIYDYYEYEPYWN